MSRADEIWNKGPDLIDDDGEVRELTTQDFKSFRPFSELPPSLQEKLLAINRGPNTFRAVEDTVSIPLPKSTAKRLEETGQGWQDRVDEVLREWLDRQKAS
jgi:uncharacterized protein (DUF4415 family)